MYQKEKKKVSLVTCTGSAVIGLKNGTLVCVIFLSSGATLWEEWVSGRIQALRDSPRLLQQWALNERENDSFQRPWRVEGKAKERDHKTASDFPCINWGRAFLLLAVGGGEGGGGGF